MKQKNRKGGLIIKRLLLFPVLILTGIVSVLFTLNLLDNIVHGTLYNYGLQFSYDWANPYWMTLRVVQALLGLIIVGVIVNTGYLFKMKRHKVFIMSKIGIKPKVLNIEEITKPKIEVKQPKIRMIGNKKSSASPTIEEQFSDVPSSTFKCGHCEKIFAQPLRMFDFHQNKPRILIICPFCNDIIHTESLREESTTVGNGSKLTKNLLHKI